MTNGYIVLTKGEPNLYKHAIEAITLGKPIYYADGNKVAFVNSIELVSTDVVIKTSDKQITVASDGTTTEIGNVLDLTEFYLTNNCITDEEIVADGNELTDEQYNELMAIIRSGTPIVIKSSGLYDMSGTNLVFNALNINDVDTGASIGYFEYSSKKIYFINIKEISSKKYIYASEDSLN